MKLTGVLHTGDVKELIQSFRLGAPGSEVEIGQYSSGKNQWRIYSGTYTVPDGVTTLRVRFHHISVAGGDGGGNHLDSIEIINNY